MTERHKPPLSEAKLICLAKHGQIADAGRVSLKKIFFVLSSYVNGKTEHLQ